MNYLKFKPYLHFHVLCCVMLMFGLGCASIPRMQDPSERNDPIVEREFRGAWVATVSNIDWPTKPGLSTEEQQQEALAILDTLVALNMNAVIFQVRPHCDAMYSSALEPWSYYLTGMQGKPPEPYYDPLQFWIEESHKRGIELHAWFNPYRAHLSRRVEITDSSIVMKRPELVRQINEGMYWLDPSLPETQDHSFNVVMDVVKRYDIDGVHFDDYFYPYGDGGFPDDTSWSQYQETGGKLSREDWRRSHVNTFIHRVYRGIKDEKPYVKFGISPFGIWRPTYPRSIAGFDQYNRLFADARLWLREGWVDYWTPQLYWPVNQIPQSFPVLLGWWSRENVKGRNLWPGMIIGRNGDEKVSDEIINQIMIERGFVPDNPGHIHFSMKAFLRDSSVLNQQLLGGPYQRQSLVPPSPWLDNTPPKGPSVQMSSIGDTALSIQWKHARPDDIFRTVVYFQYNAQWNYKIVSAGDTIFTLPLKRTVTEYPRRRRDEEQTVNIRTEFLRRFAVSAVDRTGNESEVRQQDVVQQAAEESQEK